MAGVVAGRFPGRLRSGSPRSGYTACAVARVGRRERLRPVRVHIVARDRCFRDPFSRAVLRVLSIGRNRPKAVHLFPLRFGQHRLLFTVGTQQADEPLRGAKDQRAGEQVRMHAHVPQPRDAAPCAVRMDRREHEMARQRAADRHRRRIGVADLAEHDDVGVLTQKGAQRSAEGQADLLFELYLVHSLERVFDRVLDRKDVARLAVQPPERRVERRALARAGRSGDQRHAVRARDGRLVVGELPLRETEVRELQQLGMARQQAQHDFLSVNRRKRRDAQVELAIAPEVEDAPVLRQAALRNIQVRHDLDLVDDRGVAAPVEHVFLDEFAIDSQPDAAALLVGLEMDVARIFVECFADQVRKKALSAADAAQVGRPPRYRASLLPAVVAVQQQGELVRPNRLDLYPESRQHLDLL